MNIFLTVVGIGIVMLLWPDNVQASLKDNKAVDEYTVDSEGNPIWIRYHLVDSLSQLEMIAGDYDVAGKTYKAPLPDGYDYSEIYLVYYFSGGNSEMTRLHERRHAIEGEWHTPWKEGWFSGWSAIDKKDGQTFYAGER